VKNLAERLAARKARAPSAVESAEASRLVDEAEGRRRDSADDAVADGLTLVKGEEEEVEEEEEERTRDADAEFLDSSRSDAEWEALVRDAAGKAGLVDIAPSVVERLVRKAKGKKKKAPKRGELNLVVGKKKKKKKKKKTTTTTTKSMAKEVDRSLSPLLRSLGFVETE
tara:strand:- start:127 stop:633 length:507 start_codon:yes stop_codon:yes gene_type:complete